MHDIKRLINKNTNLRVKRLLRLTLLLFALLGHCVKIRSLQLDNLTPPPSNYLSVLHLMQYFHLLFLSQQSFIPRFPYFSITSLSESVIVKFTTAIDQQQYFYHHLPTSIPFLTLFCTEQFFLSLNRPNHSIYPAYHWRGSLRRGLWH